MRLIRNVDPSDSSTISLVARRMMDTLIEVEGEERGRKMYTLEWLEDRVRWHLDPDKSDASVIVGIESTGEIAGHSIFRIESPKSDPFGLISTTYVAPGARKSGWAKSFLRAAHDWFSAKEISMVCTWTSSTNIPLISLYQKHGYRIVAHGPNDITGTVMIKLATNLK